MVAIKHITEKNFRRYGRVIAYPNQRRASTTKNLFHIVLRARKADGWRIAYLIVRDKMLTRLEQHPNSFESFEPVKGRALLFVTNRRHEATIECFYLDRPIILKKGIWHGVITRSAETEIKITENARVSCRYRRLAQPLR